MKAITVMQPYATLIAIGAKRIETRSWRTSYRGPLAIHSSKRMPKDAYALMYLEPFLSALGRWGKRHDWSALPLGCVVATSELLDCVEITQHPQPTNWPTSSGHRMFLPPDKPERSFGNFAIGQFAWILARVFEVAEPIPVRGRQGLWLWDGRADSASADGLRSVYQKHALDYCRKHYGACPFSCAKDGAPNCEYHVRRLQCEPAKATFEAAKIEQAGRAVVDATLGQVKQLGGAT